MSKFSSLIVAAIALVVIAWATVNDDTNTISNYPVQRLNNSEAISTALNLSLQPNREAPTVTAPASNKIMMRYLSSMTEDYNDMKDAIDRGNAANASEKAKHFLCGVTGLENSDINSKHVTALKNTNELKKAVSLIINTGNIHEQRTALTQVTEYMSAVSKGVGSNNVLLR